MTKVTVDSEKLSRVEVIGDNGRELVRYPKSVTLSIQDDGRTLKVFISNREKQRLIPHEQDEHPLSTD